MSLLQVLDETIALLREHEGQFWAAGLHRMQTIFAVTARVVQITS